MIYVELDFRSSERAKTLTCYNSNTCLIFFMFDSVTTFLAISVCLVL